MTDSRHPVAPHADDAACGAPSLEAFLLARGPLLRSETALCLAYWATLVDGVPDVGAGDVRALHARHRRGAALPPMRSTTESLRAAERLGLMEGTTPGRYRMSPLGASVVRALPDREAVGALRGLGKASRAPRQVARGSWERFG
jgi:hypothetical protein